MANKQVSFKYGSFSDYQNLQLKGADILYFLDNGQIYKGDLLMDTVHAVKQGKSIMGATTDSEGFPTVITDKMILNFFVSLTSGKIKYVNENKELIDISAMFLEGLLINEDFLQRLIAQLVDTIEIEMPKLQVVDDGHTLKWSDSNVDKLTVLIPKNFN